MSPACSHMQQITGRLSRAPPHAGCKEGGPTGPGPGVCRLTRSAYPFRFFFFAFSLAGVLSSPARLLFEYAEDRGFSGIITKEWGVLLGDRWVTGIG